MQKISIPKEAKCYFLAKYLSNCQNITHDRSNIILTTSSNEEAYDLYRNIKLFTSKKMHKNILYFPAYEDPSYIENIYNNLSNNKKIEYQRVKVLSYLSRQNILKDNRSINDQSIEPIILITQITNLIAKLPPKSFYQQKYFVIKRNQIIDSKLIINKLINIGFSRNHTAYNNGEFAVKGNIIDIISNNIGYRIYFDWDKIENIKIFDINSQISISEQEEGGVEEILLHPQTEYIFTKQEIPTFKQNFLKNFTVKNCRLQIYNNITEFLTNIADPFLFPLFFDKHNSILEYIPNAKWINRDIDDQNISNNILECQKIYNERKDLLNNQSGKINDQEGLILKPEYYLLNQDELSSIITDNNITKIQYEDFVKNKLKNSSLNVNSINNNLLIKLKKNNFIDNIKLILDEYNLVDKILICNNDVTYNYVSNILKINNINARLVEYIDDIKIDEINNNPNNQLIYLINNSRSENHDYIKSFITDKFILFNVSDLTLLEQDKLNITKNTANKNNKRNNYKKLQNILIELDNIKQNDLLVHENHGVGRFDKIENITNNNISRDFLKIFYQDDDILYLPVENLSLIKKYNNSDQENVPLDKLGNAKWLRKKAKAKNYITEIAKEIIKISATRQLATEKSLIFNIDNYRKFCDEFPYTETEDQYNAIEDLEDELKRGKLVDRLICGDVGFGKTEVAMRAVYLVANAENYYKPQVAIIVPTTILAKQHYNNFLERFKNTNLKIVHLSRLVKPKDANLIKEQIASSKANIIIGTHVLLSKTVKFCNLKMLVIDEEQHFGVKQKEQLKNIKKSKIHILSMSATPIPRSMQMSLSGIRDLSLITTPPLDKKPIKTYLSPLNINSIKHALLNEKSRNGLSFIVCPKIYQLKEMYNLIAKYIPEISIKIAHGQLSSSEIDKIINDFYNHKFDVLLATTIIESGIDIPTANTIIIHHADTLGLSQLYQLRGRVGRSKQNAFAYLTYSKNKILSKKTLKKLQILQDVSSLGAGFTIATHDLEARGYGNLVGKEQSGNIQEIGQELYNSMLQEELIKQKNINKGDAGDIDSENDIGDASVNAQININLGINIFIPKEYIEDSDLRLKLYRQASNLSSVDEIIKFQKNITDQFGELPLYFINLLNVINIRNYASINQINAIDFNNQKIIFTLANNFSKQDILFGLLGKYPNFIKIKQINKSNTNMVAKEKSEAKYKVLFQFNEFVDFVNINRKSDQIKLDDKIIKSLDGKYDSSDQNSLLFKIILHAINMLNGVDDKSNC